MILMRRMVFMKAAKEAVKLARTLPPLSEQKSKNHSSADNIKYKPYYRRPSLPDGKNSSKFCTPPPIEIAHQKILEYISEHKPQTFDDWQRAKEHFYTEIHILSDVNYSSVLMNVFLSNNRFQTAKSYMKYLHESNLKPNILTYLQYMAMCGRNYESSSSREILDIFEKVEPFIANSPVLDLKRATYIVQGLCGTDEWRSSLDFLKKIALKPNEEIKNAIASAAIRNGDETLAWEVITRWMKGVDDIISKYTVREFIKYALKLQPEDKRKADIFIVNFFNYLEERDVIINKEEAILIEDYFKGHAQDWRLSYGKVNRAGTCGCCGGSLKFLKLSDEEFELLKRSFLEKSVKKNDIFINTTEQEFNRYIEFLQKRKPYHIVVDGLNVAYSVQDGKKKRNLAFNLLQVVKPLAKGSRKVLIMGREQMVGWPRYLMQKVAKRADLFLTSNVSQDDPFTVYAALESGPNTYLLTMDLMRDHMSRLENPRLIHLFKKWQQSHQILVTMTQDNKIKFIEPVRHNISVQGDMETGWHIPVEDNVFRESYEELNNWLCIERLF